MQDVSSETDQETEYYTLPEEALHLLPEEWRKGFKSMADNGRLALEAVQKELSQLSRISNSFTSLVSLKHAQKRLSEYKFDTNMNAIMELDMLTTAFVVAYVRLHQGGNGSSGFDRDNLAVDLSGISGQSRIRFRSGRLWSPERNRRARCGKPAVLFLSANTARHPAGICAGIGSNRR